jgi:hypothetical protein
MVVLDSLALEPFDAARRSCWCMSSAILLSARSPYVKDYGSLKRHIISFQFRINFVPMSYQLRTKVGTKLVRSWYEVDTKLVRNWYEVGTKSSRYEVDTKLVRNWYETMKKT